MTKLKTCCSDPLGFGHCVNQKEAKKASMMKYCNSWDLSGLLGLQLCVSMGRPFQSSTCFTQNLLWFCQHLRREDGFMWSTWATHFWYNSQDSSFRGSLKCSVSDPRSACSVLFSLVVHDISLSLHFGVTPPPSSSYSHSLYLSLGHSQVFRGLEIKRACQAEEIPSSGDSPLPP